MRKHTFHLGSFFIWIVLACTLASTACTAGMFYARMSSILTQRLELDAASALKQVNAAITKHIALVDMTFPMFVANPSILNYIDPASSRYEATYTQKKLEIERQMSYLLINTYLWNERYISAVYLRDLDGNNYAVSKTGIGPDRLSKNLQVLDHFPSKDPALRLLSMQENHSLAFVRNIYSPTTGKWIAAIVIDIDEMAFHSSYMTPFGHTMRVALFDEAGRFLTGSGGNLQEVLQTSNLSTQEAPVQVRLDGETWMLASGQVSSAGVRSYVALSQTRQYQELNTTIASLTPVLLALCAAMLLGAFALSAFVTQPIRRMMLRVRDMSGTNRKEIPAGMYVEFNELAASLNDMTLRQEAYYHDLYEAELLRKNAQIRLLRSQVNPHFIFNMLNTISWKADLAGITEVADLTIALGDLLRSEALNEETDEISLGQELENIRLYLKLQKARFEDRLEFSLDVPNSLDCCMVPRLSLQPLVENAIVHGLEGKAEPSHLHISASVNGVHTKTLLLVVEDDGVGFNLGCLADATKPSGRHTRIGIENIRRRIALLYGNEYGLVLQSAPGNGTKATMTLPYKEASVCSSC